MLVHDERRRYGKPAKLVWVAKPGQACFAGRPSVGAEASHALTSKSDPLKGAGQQCGGDFRIHFENGSTKT
jgi:hypothetical protein